MKPGQLLERFGSMTASEIRRTNENLLRNFVRNYHQNRDLVPYAVGTYKVIGTLPLTKDSFCTPGLVALLQAVEQPEILLEQPFTCDEKNLPNLKHSLNPGQEIKLEKPLDLSAVIHITRLKENENRLLLTTMPLLYGSYGSAKGGTSFSLEPPAELNLEGDLPVLSNDQIAELSGGKIGKSTSLGLKLSRIPEEEATPTPEPKVAKAVTVSPPVKAALPATEPTVARAIPVNAQPILPAIPVNTPVPVATPIPATVALPAIPVATPVAPVPVAPLAVATPISTPVATPVAKPSVAATPAPVATNAVASASPSTNPPTAANPSEVWPIYAPGQMPRGRLVDSSEGQSLAARGVGGERNYLQGRFAVTASGNGRAVLRPQGAIAGVSVGPSAKVRVIVEFPAGVIPPNEGSTLSRDNLRPFQITSVKRGDDGQINIYAREVTRGQ
jgi:hypothetical protein